jgi:ankyrin repeat protein
MPEQTMSHILTDELITAARMGEWDPIAAYLESGGDINAQRENATGTTLLIEAASAGKAELVGILVSKGARVEQADSIGDTALHICARHDVPNVLSILSRHVKEHSINIDILNKDDYTPLQLAISNGNIGTMRVLLEAGARSDFVGAKRCSVLFQAVGLQSLKAVEALLTSNLPPGLTSTDLVNISANYDCMPLMVAAQKCNAYLVRFLLAHGAIIEAADSQSMTALHHVCIGRDQDQNNTENQLETLRALLDAGARRDVQCKGGRTTIHIAVMRYSYEVVRILLTYNLPDGLTSKTLVNIADDSGVTPLMWAARQNDPDFITLLLGYSADINAQSKNGKTALWYAAGLKPQATQELLQSGANPNLENSDGVTPLMLAAKYGNLTSVNLLLSAGAEVNSVDRCGNTSLHYACKKVKGIDVSPQKRAAVVNALLFAGARRDAQSMFFYTPLFLAIDNQLIEVARLLLMFHLPEHFNIKDYINAGTVRGYTPLMAAATRANLDLVKLLCTHGADVRLQQTDGSCALRHACSTTDVDTKSKERAAIVKILLDAGAQRDNLNELGFSVLHAVVFTQLSEAFELLLTYNLPLGLTTERLVNMTSHSDVTALMIAASKGNAHFIKRLLTYRANKDTASAGGYTALMQAVCNRHFEATKVLLDVGANPNCVNILGETPMFLAVRAYDLACAKLLLQHGALLNNAPYIAGALREAPAERYPQSDAMFHFLHSQGALLPSEASDVPLRPGTTERLAPLRQQDAPYAAAIASGPAAVRALLETPGLRPLRWRDTRMAKHANNGTYELLVAKAQADERLALYQGSQRVFVSYIADRIQEANQYYKGEEEKKVVPCNLDVLIMICGLNKKHLPQYPHLTKEDIEDVQKAVLSRLKSNAETLAKWRAIQAHMADSENEEYKIFRGAPEKIAELKARAAAESQRGDASRALLFSDSGKRAAASRPRAAAAGRPAKQAKAMVEVDSSEEAPKGKRAKRKLS